jgi:hypothetical protein
MLELSLKMLELSLEMLELSLEIVKPSLQVVIGRVHDREGTPGLVLDTAMPRA